MSQKKVKRHLREEVGYGLAIIAFATLFISYFVWTLKIREYPYNTSEYYVTTAKPSNIDIPLPKGESTPVPAPIVNTIASQCRKCDIPVELGLAIAYEESRFIDEHVHQGGGYTTNGIMGLSDTYLEYFCEKYNSGEMIDPHNATSNIQIGVAILADLYDIYDGDIYDVASAYHYGVHGWDVVNMAGGSETNIYGYRVTDHYGVLKEWINNPFS